MDARIRTRRPACMLPGPLLSAVLLSGLLSTGIALAQTSEVYQWKDARGVTHFSDAPPPKGRYDSRVIQAREGTPAPAAEAGAAGKPDPRAAANCTLARTNLARLNAGGDIGLDADGDGKPDSTMSADDRVKQTKLAEANIKTWCGSTDAPAAP